MILKKGNREIWNKPDRKSKYTRRFILLGRKENHQSGQAKQCEEHKQEEDLTEVAINMSL